MGDGGKGTEAGQVVLTDKQLGEILLARGLINRTQLESALAEHRKRGVPLGQILVGRKLITQRDLGLALQDQLGIKFVDLSTYIVDPVVAAMLPEKVVRQHQCLPLDWDEEASVLTVATANPLDLHALQAVKLASGLKVQTVLVEEPELVRKIDEFFDVKKDALQAIEDSANQGDGSASPSLRELEAQVDEAPVVRLVNSVLTSAVASAASDIHIEPTASDSVVRFRVDGQLQHHIGVPRRLHAAVISRVKIMSGMDIAERRLPQDGRIGVIIRGHEIDMRVSSLLTVHGEKVVLRILDKATVLRSMGDLGLLPNQVELLRWMMRKPYGMILVTGPTGSGKTTTLYTVLNELNQLTKNIVTVEDPVEYEIAGLNQTQINEAAGITFANQLRAILRQDPNIILVGEIRDLETAEISIQSALTGHLVFSTLHTNDAPSALIRLLDMGIEPFLSASSVIGVVAQRLVRVICSECRETYKAEPGVILSLGATEEQAKDAVLARGQGCPRCNWTGFKGRTALYEIMPVSNPVRRLVLSRASSADIRQEAISLGMMQMRDVGLVRILAQITTPEEVAGAAYIDSE